MYANIVYPAKQFIEMFKSVFYTSSTDKEDRPAMAGVLLTVKDGKLRMVATDGHRMVVRDGLKVDGYFYTILPVDVVKRGLPFTVSELKRLNGETLKITLREEKIGIRFKNREIVARLIEGPYPDYEKVIPEDIKNSLTVNRESLINKLRNLLIFTNQVTRQIKFTLNKKKVTLTAASPEGEKTEVVIGKPDAEYYGEAMEVAYNGAYLLEILSHLSTSFVRIRITGPMSAAMVLEVENDRDNNAYRTLLMPILLD